MERDVYSYIIPDAPLQTLLQGDPTTDTSTQRLSWWQTKQSNVDLRNGNITIRDTNNTRIIIGLLPDGTYGFVVTKPGFNAEDVFVAS